MNEIAIRHVHNLVDLKHLILYGERGRFISIYFLHFSSCFICCSQALSITKLGKGGTVASYHGTRVV